MGILSDFDEFAIEPNFITLCITFKICNLIVLLFIQVLDMQKIFSINTFQAFQVWLLVFLLIGTEIKD